MRERNTEHTRRSVYCRGWQTNGRTVAYKQLAFIRIRHARIGPSGAVSMDCSIIICSAGKNTAVTYYVHIGAESISNASEL